MTDKLDPGWVNDRLPTKKDWDGSQDVFRYTDYVSCSSFTLIEEGEHWAKIPKDFEFGENWWDNVATPQECIDREKGEEESHFDSSIKEYKRVKGLEQALAKSEEHIKELEDDLEIWKEWKADSDTAKVIAEQKNQILKKLLTQEWRATND